MTATLKYSELLLSLPKDGFTKDIMCIQNIIFKPNEIIDIIHAN